MFFSDQTFQKRAVGLLALASHQTTGRPMTGPRREAPTADHSLSTTTLPAAGSSSSVALAATDDETAALVFHASLLLLLRLAV